MDEVTEAELLEMFDGEIPPTVYRTLANPKVIDKRARLQRMADVWAKRAKRIPPYRMDEGERAKVVNEADLRKLADAVRQKGGNATAAESFIPSLVDEILELREENKRLEQALDRWQDAAQYTP